MLCYAVVNDSQTNVNSSEKQAGPVNRAGIWKNALRCLTCMNKQMHCFVLVNKN